jgi:uncharacterized membrane protein
MSERILVSSAYLFGIPALYIVLTAKKKDDYIRRHGSQAFLLWVLYFVIFFLARFLIDWQWSRAYSPQLDKIEILLVALMGFYAIFCGYRSLLGKEFRIPY